MDHVSNKSAGRSMLHFRPLPRRVEGRALDGHSCKDPSSRTFVFVPPPFQGYSYLVVHYSAGELLPPTYILLSGFLGTFLVLSTEAMSVSIWREPPGRPRQPRRHAPKALLPCYSPPLLQPLSTLLSILLTLCISDNAALFSRPNIVFYVLFGRLLCSFPYCIRDMSVGQWPIQRSGLTFLMMKKSLRKTFPTSSMTRKRQ